MRLDLPCRPPSSDPVNASVRGDQHIQREEIAKRFGEDVGSLVQEVTDDKSLPSKERKRLQAEHAPRKSRRAKILKLADKISNIRSLANEPPDWCARRRLAYVQWGRDVVTGLRGASPPTRGALRRSCPRSRKGNHREVAQAFSSRREDRYDGIPATASVARSSAPRSMARVTRLIAIHRKCRGRSTRAGRSNLAPASLSAGCAEAEPGQDSGDNERDPARSYLHRRTADRHSTAGDGARQLQNRILRGTPSTMRQRKRRGRR